MSDKQETIADIIAWLRKPREGENAYLTLWRDEIADRLDAAHKRERGGRRTLIDIAMDAWNAVASHPQGTDGLPLLENATKSRDIDLSNIHAVCFNCAPLLGFKLKDKAVGVWPDDCGVCHQHKPCTDLWHDWEPIKKGENK